MEKEPVIIALTGKGGVGKTSISATIVKILAKEFPDKKILAIDADPAIGLGTALEVKPEITLDDIRTEIINSVEEGDTKNAMELVSESRYRIFEAIVETDNFAFLAIGRPESEGCYCRINSYLKNVIEMVSSQFDFVVIDGEAGIEQINRRVMQKVSHLLLVTDASRKGLEVIKTINEVAKEMVDYERIGVVINRIEDMSLVEQLDTGKVELLGLIPTDKNIITYDVAAKNFMELPDDTISVVKIKEVLKKFGVLNGGKPE
ncbi:MAG: AAA family ATPase [Peptostreptococcaceae bacterium]|nr:AAA family ATPase [Peptostreptococcaceae bacterium]